MKFLTRFWGRSTVVGVMRRVYCKDGPLRGTLQYWDPFTGRIRFRDDEPALYYRPNKEADDSDLSVYFIGTAVDQPDAWKKHPGYP